MIIKHGQSVSGGRVHDVDGRVVAEAGTAPAARCDGAERVVRVEADVATRADTAPQTGDRWAAWMASRAEDPDGRAYYEKRASGSPTAGSEAEWPTGFDRPSAEALAVEEYGVPAGAAADAPAAYLAGLAKCFADEQDEAKRADAVQSAAPSSTRRYGVPRGGPLPSSLDARLTPEERALPWHRRPHRSELERRGRR